MKYFRPAGIPQHASIFWVLESRNFWLCSSLALIYVSVHQPFLKRKEQAPAYQLLTEAFVLRSGVLIWVLEFFWPPQKLPIFVKFR
jgi:hypothetical protein